MKKVIMMMLCAVLGFTMLQPIYAEEFEGNEEVWLSKCSIAQESAAEAEQCRRFKEYYATKQDGIQDAIADLQDESNEVKDHMETIQKLIDQQDALINELDKKIKHNEGSIQKIKEELTILKDKIKEKELHIEERSRLIKERMQSGQTSVGINTSMEILMGAEDIMDLIRRMEGIQKITDLDQKEIKALNEEKAELAVARSEQDRLMLSETDKKKENEEAKHNAESLKSQREEVLKEYHRQEAQLNAKMRNRKADLSDLQGKIISIQTSTANQLNYNTSNNDLMSPISPVSYSAGTWHYPESFGGGVHLGADFAVGVGTQIVAPADGIILYANNAYDTYDGYLYHWIGWPLGGGNTMMFLTQVNGTTYAVSFAHMAHENFMVKAGDQVKKGQLLGCTGASGNSTGPHAHVELFNLGSMSIADAIAYFNVGADFSWGCGWSDTSGMDNICSVSGRTPCRERPENFW